MGGAVKDCLLLCADVLEGLAGLPDESIDAVVTDPPYGLEFMGQEWDAPHRARIRQRVDGRTNPLNGKSTTHTPESYVAGAAYQEWATEWATALLRVLKPGAHLVAFGGARTYHRLTCALEDAGFEIRDCLMWLYGSGFPKSKNLDDDWQGWGTALKPAWEPIVLARKPLVGTVVANVQEHGTGALNINATRTPPTGERLGGGGEKRMRRRHEGWQRPWMEDDEAQSATAERCRRNVEHASAHGRWPANVVLDEEAAVLLDAQSGASASCGGTSRAGNRRILNAGNDGSLDNAGYRFHYGDLGGASRFFYCAKASTAERGEGNDHPTVKPLDLMGWLCRLITPPGGLILDPFMGSGSTGVAALRQGFRFVGIDKSPEYTAMARRRIYDDAPLLRAIS